MRNLYKIELVVDGVIKSTHHKILSAKECIDHVVSEFEMVLTNRQHFVDELTDKHEVDIEFIDNALIKITKDFIEIRG